MNSVAEPIVASVGDTRISAHGLMRFLKLRQGLNEVIKSALVEECLLQAAEAAGIQVDPGELQSMADRTRHRFGLQTTEATHQWLGIQGLSVDDFEQSLRRKLLAAKFQDCLVAEQGERVFAAGSEQFARARLRRIVVASGDLARELAAQVREDGKDFGELVDNFSLDVVSRTIGGDLGLVLRCQLPPETGRQVFSAQAGDVVGPIEEDGFFYLYSVAEFYPPTFDDMTRRMIGRELLDRFANEQLDRAEFNAAWLAAL